MSQPKPDPCDTIINAYWNVYLALQRPAIVELLGLRDVSLPQLRVLLTLHTDGALAMSELAESLGVGLPTASHLVEKLVRAGWVERGDAEGDRRITRVRLTQEGAELIGRLREDRRVQFRGWLEHLPEAERVALLRGLSALENVAGESR